MSKHIKLLIMGVLIISSLFLYIWKRNKIDMLIDNISILEIQQDRLINENQTITIEIEKLSRADRIKQIASLKLDMVIPAPETLLVVINN